VLADPHTGVVFAGAALQSVLIQHPLLRMQALVPGQFLNPLAQVIPHLPAVASQLAEPFDGGAGQNTHPVPHAVVLVFGWQSPPQACCPDRQTPLHAFALGMHAPEHSCIPLGHAGWQASPSQVTVPPVGAVQGAHDESSTGPHVATALLSTHLPAHW
jgi:hypothetical protein